MRDVSVVCGVISGGGDAPSACPVCKGALDEMGFSQMIHSSFEDEEGAFVGLINFMCCEAVVALHSPLDDRRYCTCWTRMLVHFL